MFVGFVFVYAGVQYNTTYLYYTRYPSLHGILTHNSRMVRSCISFRKRLVKATVAATKLNQNPFDRAPMNDSMNTGCTISDFKYVYNSSCITAIIM